MRGWLRGTLRLRVGGWRGVGRRWLLAIAVGTLVSRGTVIRLAFRLGPLRGIRIRRRPVIS
jgi:hypothetical protein